MVIILNYKLLHLRHCVVITVWHMLGYIGNFCPKDKTCFVTKVIENLRMLIMSKADCCCAKLKNQVKVLFMMFRKKCVTDFGSILMT